MKKCTLYNYRVEDLSLSSLENKLEAYASRDLNPSELAHAGWDVQNGTRYIVSEDIISLRYTLSEKMIPASAIRSALDKRIVKFEASNGHTPSRSERSELKDLVLADLMVNALTVTKSVQVMILQNTNQILMSSTSKNQCDTIMVLLLKSLGMQLTIPNLPSDPMLLMTRMVIEDNSLVGIDELSVLDSGVLTHDKQKATFKNQIMQQENVQKLINGGYRVNQLAMGTESVSFTLVDDLTLKGIKYDVEFDGESVEADLLIVRDAIMEVFNLLINALEGNK